MKKNSENKENKADNLSKAENTEKRSNKKEEGNNDLGSTLKPRERENVENIENLKKDLKEKEKIIEDLTNQLRRLQAEFENYKKRVDKERESYKDYITADLIKKFLPILDSFELALEDNKTSEESKEGIKLIYAQLHSLLESLNVKEIKTLGQKFNPQFHEALLVEESDLPDGTIIEELQKGYTFNNNLLRTAKVKISKSVKKKDVQTEKHKN